MIDQELARRIGRTAVIAVITIDNPDNAIPLANALIEGGVTGIELTLRTPRALEAMEKIATAVPEMMIGAGTVLTAEQVRAVQSAGATFGVAPGFNRDVVLSAKDAGLPFAPGVMTPSEIEGAYALGCTILKFYHAGVAGGLKAFAAMTGPYAHLGLRFIPLGGVSQENFPDWMRNPSILAVGGSWIAPRDAIASAAWADITARAAAAIAAVPGEA